MHQVLVSQLALQLFLQSEGDSIALTHEHGDKRGYPCIIEIFIFKREQ